MLGKKEVLIIDNGTHEIKAGISTKSKPELIIRNLVGTPKYKRLTTSKKYYSELYIGPDITNYAGMLKYEAPMEYGKITNPKLMTDVWQRVADMLDVDMKGMSVIITDTPLNPIPNKREIYRTFFNEFDCAEVLIASPSVLTLYGVGLTNGLVLDCGEGGTHALPVVEDFSVSHAVTRSNIGGRTVTDYLQYLLRMKGYDFSSSSEYEIVREIKEKFGVLELETNKIEGYKMLQNTVDDPVYILPDGTQFDVRAERFLSSEVLFNPDLINSEQPSVLDCLTRSVGKMDYRSRKRLMENVLVTGGTSQLINFSNRLSLELRAFDEKVASNYRFYQTKDWKTGAWSGAKIIADLNTYTDMWVKKNNFSDGTKIDSFV